LLDPHVPALHWPVPLPPRAGRAGIRVCGSLAHHDAQVCVLQRDPGCGDRPDPRGPLGQPPRLRLLLPGGPLGQRPDGRAA
ncbi:unnamed protein product, partial [Heterosigma akashiwo]